MYPENICVAPRRLNCPENCPENYSEKTCVAPETRELSRKLSRKYPRCPRDARMVRAARRADGVGGGMRFSGRGGGGGGDAFCRPVSI
eukprot:951391-Prorocentrum_minimum.AAC.4